MPKTENVKPAGRNAIGAYGRRGHDKSFVRILKLIYAAGIPNGGESRVANMKSDSAAADTSVGRVIALMCLSEALSMTGFAAYPAFLALLRDIWLLSNSEAGLIGGAYFAGYMAAVPMLSGLTDRFDARRVHIFSCALAGFSNLCFALFADGVLTAALFQALAGAGLGGTYMPGLKALTDRVGGPRQSRYIAYYTSTFGIGTSLSLLLAGWLGKLVTWQWTFGLLALGPSIAAALVFIGLRPHPPPPSAEPRHALPRFDIVLRDRGVVAYVIGYAVHCYELFGLRSWMVAFIIFAFGLSSSQPWVSATEAAALINFLGIPVSILGNEAAGRFGRARYIPLVMGASGLLAWVAGYSAAWPWWLMLLLLAGYFVAVMSDSAALTAGLIAATMPHQRGAAMAVYSFSGFGAGFLAPLVFGAVLDLTGGKTEPMAWCLAFGSLGAGCLIASTAGQIRKIGRQKEPGVKQPD